MRTVDWIVGLVILPGLISAKSSAAPPKSSGSSVASVSSKQTLVRVTTSSSTQHTSLTPYHASSSSIRTGLSSSSLTLGSSKKSSTQSKVSSTFKISASQSRPPTSSFTLPCGTSVVSRIASSLSNYAPAESYCEDHFSQFTYVIETTTFYPSLTLTSTVTLCNPSATAPSSTPAKPTSSVVSSSAKLISGSLKSSSAAKASSPIKSSSTSVSKSSSSLKSSGTATPTSSSSVKSKLSLLPSTTKAPKTYRALRARQATTSTPEAFSEFLERSPSCQSSICALLPSTVTVTTTASFTITGNFTTTTVPQRETCKSDDFCDTAATAGPVCRPKPTDNVCTPDPNLNYLDRCYATNGCAGNCYRRSDNFSIGVCAEYEYVYLGTYQYYPRCQVDSDCGRGDVCVYVGNQVGFSCLQAASESCPGTD